MFLFPLYRLKLCPQVFTFGLPHPVRPYLLWFYTPSGSRRLHSVTLSTNPLWASFSYFYLPTGSTPYNITPPFRQARDVYEKMNCLTFSLTFACHPTSLPGFFLSPCHENLLSCLRKNRKQLGPRILPGSYFLYPPHMPCTHVYKRTITCQIL